MLKLKLKKKKIKKRKSTINGRIVGSSSQKGEKRDVLATDRKWNLLNLLQK
jgi:hypothetical protein